jgi:hypothetical protein
MDVVDYRNFLVKVSVKNWPIMPLGRLSLLKFNPNYIYSKALSFKEPFLIQKK